MGKSNSLYIGLALVIVGFIGLMVTSYFTPSWLRMDSMMMKPGPRHYFGHGLMSGNQRKTTFKSNGERIYYTATSNSKKTIRAKMGGMEMSPPMMSCVDCHGENGKGGTVRMMMGSFKAPNITYKELTKEENPPYTDKLLKRAVTKGLHADGSRLEPPMPKWSISNDDLNDLIDYLKSL